MKINMSNQHSRISVLFLCVFLLICSYPLVFLLDWVKLKVLHVSTFYHIICVCVCVFHISKFAPVTAVRHKCNVISLPAGVLPLRRVLDSCLAGRRSRQNLWVLRRDWRRGTVGCVKFSWVSLCSSHIVVPQRGGELHGTARHRR